MKHSSPFTETAIRSLTTDQSFERGYRYYKSNTVSDVVRRGRMITAKVEGSDYEPYQIQVLLGESVIEETSCTCPYDRGGVCKHIVATLLTILHKEDEIETKPELATLLDGLDAAQLRQLLLQIAAEKATLAELIEQEIKWMEKAPVTSAAASLSMPVVTIDINAVRREISKDFRLAGKGDPYQSGYYDEYAGLEVYAHEILQPHLGKVTMLLDAGDSNTAEQLITAICDSFSNGIAGLDEWVYEYNEDAFGEAAFELGEIVAEVILSQELSAAQKENWSNQIEIWEKSLSYLDIATTALEHGWTYPPLVAAMEGRITETGAWENDPPYFADELALGRLRILARQGKTDAYIHLAEAEGQTSLAVNMMARTGQTERAVKEAKSYLIASRSILSLGQILAEQGETNAILEVAEYGLGLEQDTSKAELAQWARDQAQAAEKPELALKAAQVAFTSSHELADYQAVQQLAGAQWPTIKPPLLTSLHQSHERTKKIDIYLHEGLLKEAMEAIDKQGFFSDYDLQRVIEATREMVPDWGIRKYKQKAEQIMDGGQSKGYDTAVSWLAIAKGIYQQHKRSEEWQRYLTELLQTHGRKYKLVPMLKNLR